MLVDTHQYIRLFHKLNKVQGISQFKRDKQ